MFIHYFFRVEIWFFMLRHFFNIAIAGAVFVLFGGEGNVSMRKIPLEMFVFIAIVYINLKYV